MEITRIPLGSWIESGLTWLTSEYSVVTRGISRVTQAGINSLNDGLMWLPEWALLAIIALLCWKLASTRLAIGAVAGLALIWNLGLWNPMIETLTLVVIATLVAVVIALPVGIAAALSERLYRVIMPVLDFMQTMPAFVYLIPALMLFGLGKVPAILATVIYAAPPVIRLTDLGIRLVDQEVLEASRSFGASRKQILFGVQLPLALPNIMAGINQTTMMSISMVVIASVIGARGLGEQVLMGIQRLDVGAGMEAGIAIVLLAVVFDRIGQAYGKRSQRSHAEDV